MADQDNDHPSFSFGRKFSAGFHVLVTTLAIVALVIMVNYLSSRHIWRQDISASALSKLSPLTLRVLGSLTNQVKVIVYFNPEKELYGSVTALLKEYTANSSKLLVQLVNPLTSPAEAQIIKTKYKLASSLDKDLVIFDGNGITRILHPTDLADFQFEEVPNEREREYRRRTTAFRGELAFTSALLGITQPRTLKAYFLQDHREHNPANNDEQVGYSRFALLLGENKVQSEKLSLLGSGDVPTDCNLLIIAAPLDAIPQDELDKIDRYLNQGGRLLALFNNNTMNKPIGLEKILADWGVVVGENLVLDPQRAVPKSGGMELSLNLFGTHPCVTPLEGGTINMLLPRSVSPITTQNKSPDAPKVTELLYTGEQGVAVTDIRDGVARFDPARVVRRNYPLIVAVEKGNVKGVSAGRGSTRIIVAGDSFFLSNQMIDSAANRDFAAHAVNWLLDRTELLAGIGPRTVKEYKLNLSRAQMTAVRWTLLAILPGSVLFLGLLVWFRRRR